MSRLHETLFANATREINGERPDLTFVEEMYRIG